VAEGTVSDFSAFFALAEPRLRRAFVAAYGGERGREATAEALAWAWEHWSEVQAMDNPMGYLYRVGSSRTRGRRYRVVFARPEAADAWIEPGLAGALGALT
jgi:DNA-directed RNA polymerase specialized sigma24 family protein